jgi:uncharacterized membrane protein
MRAGGLTFLLAADIMESAAFPNWDELGRLAAIALVRTFLNFFLGRDILEAQKIKYESRGKLPQTN